MKSALLLTFDPGLMLKVAEALRVHPEGWANCDRFVMGADTGNLFDRDTGGMLLIEKAFGRGIDWGYREPPYYPMPGVVVPDMSTILAYNVECRWEEQFARTVREISLLSDAPMWVLDDNNVVWNADDVDPNRVSL